CGIGSITARESISGAAAGLLARVGAGGGAGEPPVSTQEVDPPMITAATTAALNRQPTSPRVGWVRRASARLMWVGARGRSGGAGPDVSGSGSSPASSDVDSTVVGKFSRRRDSLQAVSAGASLAETLSIRASSAARSPRRAPQTSLTQTATSRLVAGGQAFSRA